jgi:hypothetical protein
MISTAVAIGCTTVIALQLRTIAKNQKEQNRLLNTLAQGGKV